jgi:glycosyltransferase 2 family protein
LKYNKFLLFLIPVIIYLIFFLFTDLEKIWNELTNLKIEYFLIFIGFWSLGVFLRILRWDFFIKKNNVKIPFKRNVLYYLAGYSMLLSPGRMGEIIRSPFIKRDYGVPISKTASLVIVERFYEFLANIAIISIGLFFTTIDKSILVIPAIIVISMILILVNKKLFLKCIKIFERFKITQKILLNFEDAFDIIINLFKPKNFGPSFILSMGVVTVEAIAVFSLIHAVNSSLDFASLTVIFHTSAFIGAVSFIPAGLGVVEGGLLGLLLLYEIPEHVGIIMSVLLRIVATGLFTVIGIICLRYVSKNAIN